MNTHGKRSRTRICWLPVAGISFVFLFAGPLTAGTTRIVVEDRIIADKPVSPELYGGMSAVTDGRPENMLSQMLFDRGFELKHSTFSNNDFGALDWGEKREPGTGPWQSDGWRHATWWHSGYEENEWYLVKAPDDTKSEYFRDDGQGKWPAGVGEYFARVNNRSKTSPISLAQDGIRVRKGISYTFSGLLCDGENISAQRESKNPVTVTVALYPEKHLDQPPLTSAELVIDTAALNPVTIHLPACDKDARATFAITVPAGRRISADMLSLQPSDSVDGFRPEVIQAVKRVDNGPIRWPGGCDASNYDWRGGIGPVDGRPTHLHTWWGLEDLNDIGTVEFVKFCRLVGAEPMICVPLMFGTAENAADWVAFCNAKTHLLRPDSGAAGPLNVKYWEMDNEPYRRFDAITYAQRVVQFSQAMKAVDLSIKIIMGNYWIFHAKFKEMLDIAGPQIDIVNNRGGDIQDFQHDAALLKVYNAAHGRDITLIDSEYNANDWDPIGQCARKMNAPPSALEGGALQPVVDKNSKRSYLDKKCRWDYAMGVLSDFMDFHNLGGSIQFINFFCTMDFWGSSLVECGKDRVFDAVAGQALAFLKDQPIAWPLAVSKPNQDISFKASAAWNSQKTELTVLILNYDAKDKDFSVDLSGFRGRFQSEVSIDRIYAPSPDTYNSEDTPSQVVRETVSGEFEGIALQQICKPYSATAIRFKAIPK